MITANTEKAKLLHQYYLMNLIRAFEESAIELFAKGLIMVSPTRRLDRKRSPAGASASEPDDQILATYRGHGEVLASVATPSS